ncbi:COX15/CtaA family protein [Terriglobus aquaticus]|uniref:COX15/CtaA family protein n=1 Tax=Terriglobus aquaticus TaxID=940139 RepID=A0ABW9KKS7_9BACT|nr:COX15/CtaA family protein [Terriglobus aquaticus]
MATTLPAPVRTGGIDRKLTYFAWLTLGWNVLVVIFGAVVRSTGSGAGCGNHWPLCNGEVIPVSPGLHTVIEFTHRMMTGVSGWLVLGLLLAVLRWKPRPDPARKAAVATMGFLILEALLGAVLVKLGYVTGNRSTGRVVALAIHLTNTLTLVAFLTLTAWLVSGRPKPRLALGAWLTLVVTALMGVSGSLAALGDTLFPATSLRAAFAQDFTAGAPMLLRLRTVHPVSVVLATGALLWAVTRVNRSKRLASWTLALFASQIVAGIVDLVLLAPWWMQVVHLLGADLYWVSLLLLLFSTDAVPEANWAPQMKTPATS